MPQTDYETMWNSVWESVRNYNNVDADQVNAFFSRLVPQAFSEGFLMLTASTEFIKKWVETNYIHLIKQALEEQYQVPFNVAIEVDSSSPYIPTITQAPHTPAEMQPEETHIQEETTSQNTYQSPQTLNTQAGLISEYSFDNFVVGSSNKIAYSMALSVAENPGQSLLNPLFLYGKSGLGKTHLLRAIQNYVTQNYPHYNTIYTDTNELVNDYTEASRSGDFHSFNKPYDNADMILIDDVQYLEGRPGTIDLVFQKLNSMTARGKQVVFAADRAPKNIDLNERIISRFSSGGLQDIQPPEVETKLGIIRNYISMLQEKGELLIPLSDAVQMYIAQNSSSNVRE
ncbi:MAG: ATP-binding protein, partial [Eggerthellaceae bacterium]|nr:ATP-binding protein [Eggerthellaceae bacterium]